jgi:hypothetical protein
MKPYLFFYSLNFVWKTIQPNPALLNHQSHICNFLYKYHYLDYLLVLQTRHNKNLYPGTTSFLDFFTSVHPPSLSTKTVWADTLTWSLHVRLNSAICLPTKKQTYQDRNPAFFVLFLIFKSYA